MHHGKQIAIQSNLCSGHLIEVCEAAIPVTEELDRQVHRLQDTSQEVEHELSEE